jgi:hypothetical protein
MKKWKIALPRARRCTVRRLVRISAGAAGRQSPSTRRFPGDGRRFVRGNHRVGNLLWGNAPYYGHRNHPALRTGVAFFASRTSEHQTGRTFMSI